MKSGDKGIWDVPWMTENFSDEDSDNGDSEESEEEEKQVKKPTKIDPRQGLMPHVELETDSLPQSET